MSDIKDFPTPGFLYRMKKEPKGLWGIAQRAYGIGKKWRVIWKANKSNARSDDPNQSFWPGDIITIPGDAPIDDVKEDLREDVLPTLEDRGRDDFTLIIENSEIPVTAGRVLRSIDTAADGWTATTTWDPNNVERSELFRPYGYQDSAVYLGGKLSVRGYLYVVSPSLNIRERIISFEGWSFTADAIDSTIKPPLQYNNKTLEQIARDLLEPLGIEVEFNVEEDEKFKRVAAEKQDTIFAFLSKIAKQRAVLFTSTPQGNALFTKAASGGIVGSILEEFPPFQDATIKFDGRERFNVYKALGQSPKKNSKWAVANDPEVPKSRFTTFSADESNQKELEKAAEWQRSKQLADALTIKFPVNSWYAPNKELWKPNTLVTVISPTIFTPFGFDFLIREVEYIFEPGGTPAVLGLVPPQVYTGEELEEPWL
jgi:prophage tail gpP-like protein